jgi:hypothetical protein
VLFRSGKRKESGYLKRKEKSAGPCEENRRILNLP